MPLTLSDYSGDGVAADLIDLDTVIPDSGNVITVSGRIQKVGSAVQLIPSTPVTGPGIPGSGSNYWIIQVDYTVGTVTTKTSTSLMPTADAGNVIIFQQTLNVGENADLAVDPGVTPDSW